MDYLTMTGGATGSPGIVTIGAAGSDTDVNIKLAPKGAGSVSMSFANSNAGLYLNQTTASKQVVLAFFDQGTTKWGLGKQTDNSFFISDAANSVDRMRIDTSGNVIFQPLGGYVGIGSTAPDAQLNIVANSAATATDAKGLHISGAPSTADTGTFYGADINPTYTATSGSTLVSLYGARVTPQNTSTDAVSGTVAVGAYPANSSGGTVGNMYAVNAATTKSGTGVVTNMYALYGRCDNTNATGTVGTCYELYLDTPNATSTITNKYGVYQTDTGTTNYFAGNVGIGTPPAAQLQLSGNRSAAAWTTNGIGLRIDPATYTDTSSSGTVALQMAHNIGPATFAASSATTYTNGATLYVSAPTAGANVTLSNPYAIYTNGNIYSSGSNNAFANGGVTPLAVLDMGSNIGTAVLSTTYGRLLKVNGPTITDTVGSGTIATRIGSSFAAPTFAASSTETVTAASTLSIAGAPAAGTNVTITNPLALNVNAGTAYFGGNVGIGTAAPASAMHILSTVASTNIIVSNFNVGLASSGTPAAGFGNVIKLNLDNTSNVQVGAADIGATRIDPTASSEKGALILRTKTSGTMNERVRIDNNGNVGVGTTLPQATLDVNGYMKLKVNGSAPVTCSSTYDGAIALTHVYTLCACKGGSSAWVQAGDGATACTW